VSREGSNASADAVRGSSGTLVFAFAAATAFIALLLVRTLPPWRRPAGPPGPAVELTLARAAMGVLRTPGIASAMFVSLAVASALDVFIVYLPAYGEVNGLSVVTVGALLALRAASTLVSRAFMGRLTDQLCPGSTLWLTTAVAALSFALLPMVAAIPALVVLVILIGLGLGIGQPLTVAWIGIQSPPRERGLAFGVRHTGNLATLTIVPAGMGLIAGATGINAIWVVVAAFLGAATVVAARTRFAPLTRRTQD